MTIPISVLHTYLAIQRIQDELPTLIDNQEAQQTISKVLKEKIATFEIASDPIIRMRLSTEFVSLLANHAKARRRLLTEIEIQRSLLAHLKAEIPTFNGDENAILQMTSCLNWGLSSDEIPTDEELVDARQNSDRAIFIKQGGVAGGKSFKLQNIRFERNKLVEVATSFVIAGADIVDKPNPIVVAACVIIMGRALAQAVGEPLSEQDASVFWGFIMTCDENALAEENALLKKTNMERIANNLDELSPTQFVSSLKNLERLACIEKADEKAHTWRMLEDYYVR